MSKVTQHPAVPSSPAIQLSWSCKSLEKAQGNRCSPQRSSQWMDKEGDTGSRTVCKH